MVNAADPYCYSAATSATDVILRYAGQSTSQTLTRAITEFLGTVDSKTRLATRFRSFVEYLGETDLRSRVATRIRGFTEYLGELDLKSRVAIRFRAFTEYLGGLDLASRIVTRFRTFTEYLGGSDLTIEKVKTLHRTFIEYLGEYDLTGVHTGVYHLTGITRDSSGTVLGNCSVYLYNASDFSYLGNTTSDASTGVYSFVVSASGTYFVVAFKVGSPDVQGVTDKNITRLS